MTVAIGEYQTDTDNKKLYDSKFNDSNAQSTSSGNGGEEFVSCNMSCGPTCLITAHQTCGNRRN
ncbi:hypothetical protein GCM10022627_35860 [Haloarcula argentinensis]